MHAQSDGLLVVAKLGQRLRYSLKHHLPDAQDDLRVQHMTAAFYQVTSKLEIGKFCYRYQIFEH